MNAEKLKQETEGKTITVEQLAAFVNGVDDNVVISIDLTAGGGETVATEKRIRSGKEI